MLPLSDPRWCQFQANYTDGGHVADILSRAGKGEPLDDWYDDLFQELCHQYTVSDAAYPAAPHLVRIASSRPELRKELLILLGSCHASSESSNRGSISDEVMEEWRSSAEAAVPLLLGLLAEHPESESDLCYLLCSLAAVHGYPELATAIEGLDAA